MHRPAVHGSVVWPVYCFPKYRINCQYLKKSMIQIFKNGFLINSLVFSTTLSSFFSPAEDQTYKFFAIRSHGFGR